MKFVLVGAPPEVRFWHQVDVRLADECWPWTGALRKGYGTITLSPGDFGLAVRKSMFTHRVAFFLAHSRWPLPLARHTCDNPLCCNPKHLLEGTHKQNMADKYERGRANHPKGVLSKRSALSQEEVVEIRKMSKAGIKQKEIATRFGVSQASVSRVASGVRYQ